MEPVPLGDRLIAAEDRQAVFDETDMSLMELVDELQKFEFIQPDVWEPLNEMAGVLDIPIEKITQSIFERMSKELQGIIMEKRESTAWLMKLLNLIRPFIRNTNFAKIFQCIVSHVTRDGEDLPEWFLSELSELPISTILRAFSSVQARKALFLNSRPLFHKVLYFAIEKFCTNPMNLDMLLNTIQCVGMNDAPKRSTTITPFTYRANVVRALSKFHHDEACRDARDEIIKYCCGDQGLYDEVCCILRDLWERTSSPLLCALRLEICYASDALSESDAKLNDPLRRFTQAVFEAIDACQNNKFVPQKDLMNGSSDAAFAASDPMLRMICFAEIMRGIFERLSSQKYVPFAERKDQRALFALLCPGVSEEVIEDTANNIEALYLVLEMSLPVEELLADLRACAQQGSVVNMILFAAQHVLETRSDPRVLETVLAPAEDDESEEVREASALISELEGEGEEATPDSRLYLLKALRKTGSVGPDISVGFVMSQYLTYQGIAGDHSTLVMALLVRWSRRDRNILLYVLALLKLNSGREQALVNNWMSIMNRMGYFAEMSNIEKAMVDQL